MDYNLIKSVIFQNKTLLTDLTFNITLPRKDNLSDNPDIMKYLRYTKIKFIYFYNKSILMLRGNLLSKKGAIEVTYSYPLIKNTNIYIKLFSGYMESMINYNKNITKFSIGFSFSR